MNSGSKNYFFWFKNIYSLKYIISMTPYKNKLNNT